MLFVQLPGVGYNWRKEPCGVEAGRACPVEEVEGDLSGSTSPASHPTSTPTWAPLHLWTLTNTLKHPIITQSNYQTINTTLSNKPTPGRAKRLNPACQTHHRLPPGELNGKCQVWSSLYIDVYLFVLVCWSRDQSIIDDQARPWAANPVIWSTAAHVPDFEIDVFFLFFCFFVSDYPLLMFKIRKKTHSFFWVWECDIVLTLSHNWQW